MWKQLIVPLIALGALTFAVTHVVKSQTVTPPKSPIVEPPRSPFEKTVAGAGLIEARSDSSGTANTSVGSLLPGVVTKVNVKVGQSVKAGEALFELDDRQYQAELSLRTANLATASARLRKLEMMPRPEEVPPSAAKVTEAEANLAAQKDLLTRSEKLFATHTIGEEELIARRQSHAAAVALLAQAKANLDLLKAGAWEADKVVTRANIELATAQVQQTKIDLDRLIVRSPIDGTVLQLNVRPGEFVGASPNQTLIMLGDTSQLHVRVDIDENDIHRFQPKNRAIAKLRGDPSKQFPLTFVRVEPMVVPKKSLTGDNVERVDTRVLQAIFAIDRQGQTLYVGQQVDVFVEMTK